MKATGDLSLTTRLWGDAGNDTITAKDLYDAANLFGGDGEDILSAATLNKDNKIGSALVGGNGDDTITAGLLGNAWSEVRGDGLQGETNPHVGTGRDTITVDTNKGKVNAGNDNDTVTITLNQGTVDAGAGTDTCTITTDDGTAPTEGCEST